MKTNGTVPHLRSIRNSMNGSKSKILLKTKLEIPKLPIENFSEQIKAVVMEK